MIRPTMTAKQAEALAGYLVSLRPGERSWTKIACADALAQAAATRTNDTELLTRAALAAALSAAVKTPSVIAMPGAHWDGGSTSPGSPANPTRWCSRCKRSHVLGDCPPPEPPRYGPRHPDRQRDHIASLRAAVKTTKTYEPAEGSTDA